MMLLTEKEARNKWCPFTRAEVDGSVINRTALGYGDDEAWRCIASDCMAWRWTETVYRDPATDEYSSTKVGSYTENLKRGYCGIAGPAPEMWW